MEHLVNITFQCPTTHHIALNSGAESWQNSSFDDTSTKIGQELHFGLYIKNK
jgi:hypothetical protein